MPRNALLVEITDEDLQWAVRQNRYGCAIVRAVERKVPQALRVTADSQHIAFTIPEDQLADAPEPGVRYVFKIKDQKQAKLIGSVIESFDKTGTVPEDARQFTIVATEAKPMAHGRSRKTNPTEKELLHRNQERERQRRRAGSKNPRVHTYNRWLDTDAEMASDEALAALRAKLSGDTA